MEICIRVKKFEKNQDASSYEKMFHRFVLNCFATIWICSGLCFMIGGLVAVAFGSKEIDSEKREESYIIGIAFVTMSMIPIMIGCCMLYCIKKCSIVSTPETSKRDTIEVNTARRNEASIQISQNLEIRVNFCLIQKSFSTTFIVFLI